MRKASLFLLAALIILSFAACEKTDVSTDTHTEPTTEEKSDSETVSEKADGTFKITTSDGTYTSSEEIYTISSPGTYALSGDLYGQIVVDAGENGEVILELSGVTITYGADSPIKIISAGSADISAKKDTENVISDTRSAKTSDDAAQGEGAVYAKCDLKIKGNGTLVVNAGYNNGIHTTKDLVIQNLSLRVSARNNALKGNDSVTFKSGTVVAISTHGDGVKTENTDADKNGETRGDIVISGGTVSVYAAGDGFQAAHSVEIRGADGEAPDITVHTGSYSEYTAEDASTTSYKGVKAQNELNISDGNITLNTYDDGLHADCGTAFENGGKGQGTVNISGGTITISVYAPESKTFGGYPGPGGWGRQQTVSGADGIHADSVLNISGGTVVIDSAYEGLEANVINVSGGMTYVSASDDGVNACSGSSKPLVNVTGGYLDVSVPPMGDTDGIDSNGNYTQTGGVVITRGPDSHMAAAIDSEGKVSVSGGTLVILGYGRVSAEGDVKSVSLSLSSEGEHTVTVDGTEYRFTNAYSYKKTTCYSDVSVSD